MVSICDVKRGNLFDHNSRLYLKIEDKDIDILIGFGASLGVPVKDYHKFCFALLVQEAKLRIGLFYKTNDYLIKDLGFYNQLKYTGWVENAITVLRFREIRNKPLGPVGPCGGPGCEGIESKGTPQGPIGARGTIGPSGSPLKGDETIAQLGGDQIVVYEKTGWVVCDGNSSTPDLRKKFDSAFKIHSETPVTIEPCEYCPIDNVALWNITPPKQRKAILDLISRQAEYKKEETILRNQIENLRIVENNLKTKPSPENSMSYWALTSSLRKKKEKEKEKEKFVDKFLLKKAVKERIICLNKQLRRLQIM